MTRQEFVELMPSLPTQAGVYRFVAEDEEILYIGKAKNLKKRLQSYFSNRKDMRNKTKTMVRKAHKVLYTVVETEQDALLLEATLIRKYRPPYNVMLKWSKPYPYIAITSERFPRVIYTHNTSDRKAKYFGPYTSKNRVFNLLDLIKEIFQLRTCQLHLSQENIEAGKFKVCLEYHIKNCKAPCVAFETEEEYMQKIQEVTNVLKGDFAEVRLSLKNRIERYAENMQFELAHEIQQKLQAFENYQSRSTVVSATIKDVDVFSIHIDKETNECFVNYIKVVQGAIINTCTVEIQQNLNQYEMDVLSYAVAELREKFNSRAPIVLAPIPFVKTENNFKIQVPKSGDKKKLLDLSIKNLQYYILQQRKADLNKAQQQTKSDQLLEQMQKDLRTKTLPKHIECFDNSNFHGSFPVSAMVCFKNGKPSKKDYRHYNVKTVEGPNDFATMEEVIYRRYKRVLESKWALPDLIVVDGGKGQLSSAIKSLEALGIADKVTVIGIAKRLEEIYFPGDSIPLLLSKKSPTLKVIQQMRDEAHRFGITFHRDQRSKEFTKSELENIKGIGEKTAETLLTHFGSVSTIKTATEKDLASIIGPSMAKKIRNHFDKQEKRDEQNSDLPPMP